jgi:tRNA(fMet)-specific endonuclease VapC
LDTSALVAAQRDGFDLDRVDDDEPAVAAVTIAELGVGVEPASGRGRRARQAFLDDLLAVVDYNVHVATVHPLRLVDTRRSGQPRGAHDLIVAATARATGRVVLTLDRVGSPIFVV